ncbi:MAG: hypothetical protein ACRDWX_12470 [Acidimicrobiia bacterium]
MPKNLSLLGAAALFSGTLVGCAPESTIAGAAEGQGLAAQVQLAGEMECPEVPEDAFAVRSDEGFLLFRATDGSLKVLSAGVSGDGTFSVTQPDVNVLEASLIGAEGTINLQATLQGDDAVRLLLEGAADVQTIDLGTLGSVTLGASGDVLELVSVDAAAGVEYAIGTQGDVLRIRFTGEGDAQQEVIAQLVEGSLAVGLGGELQAALVAAGLDADAAAGVAPSLDAQVSGDAEADVAVTLDIDADADADVSVITP